MWRAAGGAAQAMQFLLFCPIADNEIANIRNPGERIREDEDRVAPMQAIDQEQERSNQAQPPKRIGNDDLLFLFGGPPLDEEAGEKDYVAGPAYDLPEVPLDAEQLIVEHQPALHEMRHAQGVA